MEYGPTCHSFSISFKLIPMLQKLKKIKLKDSKINYIIETNPKIMCCSLERISELNWEKGLLIKM